MPRYPSLLCSLVVAAGLTLSVGCKQSADSQFDPATLGLPTVARSSDATQGAAKAYLGPFDGNLAVTAANSSNLTPAVGTPLLADDLVKLGEDGLAVILYANGNVLRLEGPLELPLRQLVGFDDPPVAADFESRLRNALTQADRNRLLDSGERIGGWQLRLRALDSVAAEEAEVEEALPKGELNEAMDHEDEDEDGYAGADLETEKSRESAKDSFASTHPNNEKRADNKPRDPTPAKQSKQAGPAPAPGAGDPTPPPAAKQPKNSTPATEAGQSASETDLVKTWQQVSAKWSASGDSFTVPANLASDITHCLQTHIQRRARVVITAAAGKITRFEVEGANLKCAAQFVGRTIPKTQMSGELRVVFEQR